MKLKSRGTLAVAAVVWALLVALVPAAYAQGYPNRPVKLVAPFPAGGTTDFLARLLAQELSETWGQPVIVENKSGAGGTIGTESVASAPGDGYTLLMGNFGPIALAPFLYTGLRYDPLRDLVPITLIATTPNVLLVNPRSGVRTVGEFIALAKSKPGALSYASAGMGISNHLGMELLKQMAGIDLVHVPYKGSSPALADLVGGQVFATLDPVTSSMALVKAGKLTAIGIGSLQRSAVYPELPTIAESGVPGFENGTWNGLLAPKGTPREFTQPIWSAARDAIRKPQISRKIQETGSQVVAGTPDEFRSFIEQQQARWAPVIRQAGIKPN